MIFETKNYLNWYLPDYIIHSPLVFSSHAHTRTGGSSNLMGKFTQSVRRIVQDVKDEGTMSGLSREEVIDINERLILFRFRLEMSYDTAKQALNSLMAKYGDSKSQRNIFHRYPLLKIMIKVGEQKMFMAPAWSHLTLLRFYWASLQSYRKSSN